VPPFERATARTVIPPRGRRGTCPRQWAAGYALAVLARGVGQAPVGDGPRPSEG